MISPYRVTPEDLADLDKAIRAGLQPLLDALNITLPQLVQAAQTVTEQYVPVTLAVGGAVADSFPLVFRHTLSRRPRAVLLANCIPRDTTHSHTTPRVIQGWSLTDLGLISIPWITGLLIDQTYDFTFLVR